MRKASGLTQTALAERLGTTQATVSRWENGARTPDVVTVAKYAALSNSPRSMSGLGDAINEARRVLGGEE